MKKKIQVLDVDYVVRDGDPVVRLFGRDGEGKDFLGEVEWFRPYFYAVPSGELEELRKAVECETFEQDEEDVSVDGVEEVTRLDGNDEVEILKIFAEVPPEVPKLKEAVYHLEETDHCREYSIPFYKRFLIDEGVVPVSWIEIRGEEFEEDEFERAVRVEEIETGVEEEDPDYREVAFDLEVYQDEIIMASFYGEGFEKLLTTEEIDRDYVEEVQDEKELLERFREIVRDRDVDILTGYNTDEFDFRKLRERFQHHGMELTLGRNGERMKFKRRGRFSSARLKGRMHLDLYPFVTHILSQTLESETLDLDSVAEELLGENKDEMSWEDMKEAWREKEGLEEFADYALKDAKLAYRLAEELVPQILELSRLTGLIPFDACRLTYGQLTENFLLKEAYEKNMLAPNRPTQQDRRRRRNQGAYEGGFVYTPEAGLHEDIALFDFRSLYPTVMVAHNISPDTLNMDDCDDRFQLEEFDYDFCQDEQGFFPELVERLVEDRYRLKKEMREYEEGSSEYVSIYSRQSAEKYLANSFYGYLGYDGARWYSRECAEATTYLGREYIEDTIEMAEEKGFEVAYGDTDSVFLKGEDIRERMDEFLEDVNSELPEFMELEFEGYFVRGFFTSTDSGEGAKKKYALLDEDGDLKITGFEQVRRDWSPIAKKTQKKVLEKVLRNEIEEAAEIVKETIGDLKQGEIPVEDLRIYTTLTKEPEEYDSTAPHVEAAKKAIERGDDIPPETTIDYVITKGPGSISSRAELTKYAEDYDASYYIENQVIPVALRVLKVFGYTEGQLKGKGRQSGLGRFG
ncbi:MAG: DNA-directed DNA polymerase [Candidatus Nanohaloarchaea archaeon]